MLRDRGGAVKSSSPKKIFTDVRFVLFGFDSVSEAQYRSELGEGGGVDVGRYDSSCTHVVVSGRVFDDPVCVAARNDGKILVTELWIDDSLGFGMLADSTKVLYWPPRDLSGIPGSTSLHICLTGYQRQERDDIMRMVSLMGGRFSKPLIANQVTHLICYKFEGEKYELARKVNIKLVNHRWLEDCLKAWEILPIDSYKKSGWELEMLEAEAMDSEEEAADACKKATVQRSCAESPTVPAVMSVTIGSGTLVDTRNLGLKKNILTAKPSDLSVDSQLISNSPNGNSSGKATYICDSKSGVLDVNRSVAEQLPGYHGMGIINSKQPNTPDLVDLNMKCNGLLSNLRNSSVGMTSCEDDRKLDSVGYSRRTTEKVVSPKEQFNNLCTLDKGKPEEVRKDDVNVSSSESMDEASKNCISDNLRSPINGLKKTYVEGQTHVSPSKRKLSNSMISLKSIKSNQDSGLLDAPKGFNLAKYDFLMPQQRELENTPARDEARTGICHMAEGKDKFHQMERFPLSSTCQRSPELEQHDSGTCIKRSPKSMRPRQVEYMNAPHVEIDHGLTCTDGFEGTSFAQPRANKRGSLSKSSSLTRNRKFLKHLNSASVANISGNSSSKLNSKDELLSVPSMPALDGTVCATDEPVSRIGTMNGITSPEAMVLSDCPLNNETGLAEGRSTGNESNFLRSPLAADGGNVNEAPMSVRVLEAPLKRTRKSEADIKSHDFDGVSMTCETDIHNKAPEQHEKPGENQNASSYALKDSKVKDSVCTEIDRFCTKGKANDVSIHRNCKVLVSRSTGCRPKLSRESCKNKSSSDPLRSINSNKTASKLGNGIGELGDVDNLNEKVEKDGSPMKEKEVEHCYAPVSNSSISTLYTKQLDQEKENELKDNCKLFVKEGNDCDQKVKKICKKNLSVKRSSRDNINSFTKLSSLSTAIEPRWFILSGHKSQRKEFQKKLKQLRGRICKDSHSWSYEATHFIVPDYVRRTQKFFAAASAGRWILKSDYLSASVEAVKFVNEEPFEWYHKGLTEDGAISLEAPRKWRTLRERTGHGAFYGMRIIIYGECIVPPLDTLKRAVKAGDGTVLATSPPYTRFLKSSIDFAIVNASMPVIDVWIQEFLRHEIPCVLPDYLVEYVCKPGYSLEKHVLYETHKWAEKSFANLLSRSEELVSDEVSAEDDLSDIKCLACGSPDREDVMLICGDEARTRGCGVATHIDCCDPPLTKVPEGDWFCPSCSRKTGKKAPSKTNQVKRKKGK
ncbi:BRCT domain-containing protein At4g02110 [Phalaenopsis equestris]|uniref:BRCT domain-containing protein At4g02110 n=1 Tax=Phalaenopsis equestris TaxID=78828 RepID=UPI0009E3485E|nr:BRCT domain-containing protein At4g02110 [Phalaenopsis equestris]